MDENKGFDSADVRRGAVGGLLAGLCCLIPLIAIAAGLGFIPGIMTIPRYRTFFIIISLVAVVILTWRRVGKSKLEASQKFGVLAITTVSFFVVLGIFTYAVTPAVSGLVAGAPDHESMMNGGGQETAISNKPPALHQVTLKVTGLTCPSCKGTIENLLKRVNGVKEANVDASSGAGKVVYDANLTTKKAIAKAVEGQGTARTAYKATIVADKKL